MLVGDTRGLKPTTRAQVSGHRFLRRRVEHGLIFGDIRMIHDPLSSRQRALLFGLILAIIAALGAGLMAWISPNADPRDAIILRDPRGSLHIRLEERIHPVANLTSARLIAGQADVPAAIGEAHLAAAPKGPPLGIMGAPSLLPADAPEHWSACTDAEGGVRVVGAQTLSSPTYVVLVTAAEREWLLSAEGRRALPDASTAQGRIVRRALGIDAATPRVALADAVLSIAPELPEVRVDVAAGELLAEGENHWWLEEGAVIRLTPIQAEVLKDLGARLTAVTPDQVADYPDAQGGGFSLPSEPLVLKEGEEVCVGVGGLVEPGQVPEAMELSGMGVADSFASTAGGDVSVFSDKRAGYFVVSAVGQVHAVPKEDLAALGLAEPVEAPWSVLRLLPEGPELSRSAAVRSTY